MGVSVGTHEGQEEVLLLEERASKGVGNLGLHFGQERQALEVADWTTRAGNWEACWARRSLDEGCNHPVVRPLHHPAMPTCNKIK